MLSGLWGFLSPGGRSMARRLMGLVALAACGPREPLPYSGFVDAPIAAVASQVAGRVETIPVQSGDRVRAGQLLAELDAREREAALAQAEATLAREQQGQNEAEASSEAVLPTEKGARADIARAQATLDDAQRSFDRTERLARAGSATAADFDAARARLLEAKASLQSLVAGKDVAHGRVRAALAAISGARAAVRVAEASVETAKVQVALARIQSPYDGLVVDRNLEPGEWAAAGTPVVTVEDLGHVWVRLDVEETSFSGLRLGASATILVIALPGKLFHGHVIEVGPLGGFAVNRDVKRGRPDIRTFRVRVAFDEPGLELRPGMTAEVRLSASAAASPAGEGAPP
jgi:HlyD family secretion protein